MERSEIIAGRYAEWKGGTGTIFKILGPGYDVSDFLGEVVVTTTDKWGVGETSEFLSLPYFTLLPESYSPSQPQK